MQGDLFIGLNDDKEKNSYTKPLIPEYTVSEFSQELKKLIEGCFAYVKIKGEISGYKKSNAGHIYFSLKDNDALINAVCFRNMANNIPMELEDGMEVVVSGRVTIYAGRSNYQIIAENVSFAGQGAIMKLLEERKKKLEAEGLFDEELKKSIPYIPNHIGVITSGTGAAIRDILHRIEDRFPTKVTVFPVVVQGLNAPAEIIKAIHYFNNIKDPSQQPDVLIVARGGGSLEDLLAFSDENVVRTVAYSEIPIISGVGHETDNMLIDYASDLRAPTPTAAAELATPVKEELLYSTERLTDIINNTLTRKLLSHQDKLNLFKITSKIIDFTLNRYKTLLDRTFAESHYSMKNILYKLEQKILSLPNLNILVSTLLKNKEQSLLLKSKALDGFNYKQILKRGFSIIRSLKTNKILRSSDEINKNLKDGLVIETSDGTVKIK